MGGVNMKFSVIMPVYNVEKYLTEAINSVLAQTIVDFELILVNDASPDNCRAICDEAKSKDKRIKVINHRKNMGLSQSRNTGLKQAHGEYILFMDSDDTISPDTLACVCRHLNKNTDILIFGVNCFYQNKKGETYLNEKLSHLRTVTNNKSQVGNLLISLNKSGIFPFAWNKIYRRDFLKKSNIHFQNIKLVEDFLFNIKLMDKTKNVTVIPDCLYNYRRPAHQTLVNTYAPEFFVTIKRKHLLEMTFLENNCCCSYDNLQYIYYIYIKHLISYFIRNQSAVSHKNQKKLIKEALNDYLTQEILKKYRPTPSMKIIFWILKTKNCSLCYLSAKMINFINTNFKKLFKKVTAR